MRKSLSAAALAASIAAGGLGGALLGAPALAGAQTDDTTTAADPSTCPMGRQGGRFGGGPGPGVDAVAEALNMTSEELRAAFQDGQTVAEIAEAQGVDVQVVIDALIAAHEERLAEAVESGRLTQEQADERLEAAEEHASAFVNGERPAFRRHAGGMGGGNGMGRGRAF